MARIVQYTETGGPEVLTLVETPDPVPGPGEIAVSMRAIGVNPRDAKERAGLRGGSGTRTIGHDGAGVVTAIGEGVTAYAVGDRVALSKGASTYASDVVVPAAVVHPIPDGVSDEQAAALGIPAGTAYQLLRSLAVGEGDVLVYHGGSGAVGQAAIQFAREFGAQVVATASPKNHELLRSLGAEPVDYSEADATELATRILDAAPAAISVAIDGIGTDAAIDASIKLVDDKPRIATIVRGADAAEYGIRAFSGGSPEPLTEQELAWRADGLQHAMESIAKGTFQVQLGETFPLDEVVEAHRLVDTGHPGGKIILRP